MKKEERRYTVPHTCRQTARVIGRFCQQPGAAFERRPLVSFQPEHHGVGPTSPSIVCAGIIVDGSGTLDVNAPAQAVVDRTVGHRRLGLIIHPDVRIIVSAGMGDLGMTLRFLRKKPAFLFLNLAM